MTTSQPEPIRSALLPIPEGAMLLPLDQQEGTARELAIAALRQALAAQQLQDIPLGPALAGEEPSRLLHLNHFAIQLACTGLFHSEVSIDAAAWREQAAAPQLLLAAAVDLDNRVVAFPGVLTAEEFVALAGEDSGEEGAKISVPLERFQGGLKRLLTVVELMDLDAIPRRALRPAISARVGDGVVAVLDWLRGQIDETLMALGGELRPVAAGAFRSAEASAQMGEPIAALLWLPIVIEHDGLRLGPAARRGQETLRLEVLAAGEAPNCHLRFRLLGDPPGALLPDGLTLTASSAEHSVSERSDCSLALDLAFPPSTQAVELAISVADQLPLRLPKALLLPPQGF
jgi:hypothetical protein